MNRRCLWIAYIPIKLHLVFAILGGLCGHWIALQFALSPLPAEFIGLIVAAPIGIVLRSYKQKARAIIEENKGAAAAQPK